MEQASNKSYFSTKLFFFTISLPYIADLIFSILSYQGECKTYYIIRFVTQGISLLFIIILPFLLITLVYEQHNNPFAMGFIYIASLVYLIIGIIPMEIASLFFFIRDYELLFFLGKFGYYIHASSIILYFILGFTYVKCGWSSSSHQDKKDGNYN